MKPRIGILDPRFKYSSKTDLKAKFDAIRQNQLSARNQQVADRAAVERNFADRRQIEAEDDRR